MNIRYHYDLLKKKKFSIISMDLFEVYLCLHNDGGMDLSNPLDTARMELV